MGPELTGDVREMVLGQRPEGERLEYKATLGKVDEERVVRTLCAFANDLHNRNGGTLVLGVAEEAGRPLLPPQGLTDVDAVQRRVAEIVARIKPEYAPRIEVFHVDGSDLVAIRCPPGDARPCTVPDGKGGRQAFVRVGAVTKVASGELACQLDEVSARLPFDERLRQDLTIDALMLPTLLTHLHETGSRLAAEGATPQLWQRLDLARPVNGHVSPRNVALLPKIACWTSSRNNQKGATACACSRTPPQTDFRDPPR